MAIVPLQLARVSNLLRTNISSAQITRTQQQLLNVQNELITGQRLNSPSDDPGAAAIAMQLRKQLEKQQAYMSNIQQATSQLSEVDNTLSDVTDVLRQAQTIAMANVGSDVTADQRASAAEVVKSLYGQLLSLANHQFQGMYLFGGDKSDQPPFVEEAGGVRFVGSSTPLANSYDQSTILPFMVDGSAVFGALSSRVEGTEDLSPVVNGSTRLSDLRGALGKGITPGAIEISNGSVTASVDLSSAKSLQDVVNQINAAGIGTITAALGMGGQRLQITGGPSESITIKDVTGGSMAADLGILKPTSGGAGVAITGQLFAPQISPFTKLSDLKGGSGIDTAHGMTITNGLSSATITIAPGDTVEDLLNAINGAGVGVLASINKDGTGINILNATQNTQMTISEAGGTLAADLGVRSFNPSSPLAELNGGAGVRTAGGDDFQIQTADGTTFSVDIDGATTVQDVITRINSAAGGAVSAGFAATGNGIILTDLTAGGGTLTATPLNGSTALTDLGLNKPSAAGVVTGDDVNAVRASGIFSDMLALISGLQSGDTAAVTQAAQGLKNGETGVVQIRAAAGARVQDLETRKDRLDQQDIATKALLSDLQDTDYTEAIARFQTLQNALEASMKTAGTMMQMSLMDFIG